MKMTAEFSGVDEPLSVELTLIISTHPSWEKRHSSPGCPLLIQRSDFPRTKGLGRSSSFGRGRNSVGMRLCLAVRRKRRDDGPKLSGSAFPKEYQLCVYSCLITCHSWSHHNGRLMTA